MRRLAASYLAILVSILVLDAVWLGVVAKRFYAEKLGELMTPQVQWWAACVFYLLFAAGVLYFVVLPRAADTSLGAVFAAGAFFGLVCYGTYDLTNQAVVRNWPLVVTIVDMAWGAALTGTVALVGAWVARRFA